MRDAVLAVEVSCTDQEGRGLGTLLIGQDIDVGEPGVIVDDRVYAIEPGPNLPLFMGPGRLMAQCPPSATVGDPPQPHDINVNWFARVFATVGVPGDAPGPDQIPGDRVAPGQQRFMVAAQVPCHGPCPAPRLLG